MNLALLKIVKNVSRTSTNRGHPNSGFSLIELLIITAIIGIFAAIAAPSWEAFITRQRLQYINNDVLRVLKEAQSIATSQKKSVVVQFDPATAPPTVTIDDAPPPILSNSKGQLRPEDQGKDDLIQLSTTTADNSITFTYLGGVEEDVALPVQVTVALKDNPNTKRCVIVQTLLGAMRTAENAECN